jgi:hypothetical protein
MQPVHVNGKNWLQISLLTRLHMKNSSFNYVQYNLHSDIWTFNNQIKYCVYPMHISRKCKWNERAVFFYNFAFNFYECNTLRNLP